MAKFESGSDKGSLLTSVDEDVPSLVPKALQSDGALLSGFILTLLGTFGISIAEYEKAKGKFLENKKLAQSPHSAKYLEDAEDRRQRSLDKSIPLEAHAMGERMEAIHKTTGLMEGEQDRGSRSFKNRWKAKEGTLLGNTKGR